MFIAEHYKFRLRDQEENETIAEHEVKFKKNFQYIVNSKKIWWISYVTDMLVGLEVNQY